MCAARLLSWYTKGGFVDEVGVTHTSGLFYNISHWEVITRSLNKGKRGVDSFSQNGLVIRFSSSPSAADELSVGVICLVGSLLMCLIMCACVSAPCTCVLFLCVCHSFIVSLSNGVFVQVLNEPDSEHLFTPQAYTLFYDTVTAALSAVQPGLRYVGMALETHRNWAWWDYFLNASNHRVGAQLDYASFHFYSHSTSRTDPSNYEQFFPQCDDFVEEVRNKQQSLNCRQFLMRETQKKG